jgi:heptosyltransferase-2
MKIRRILVLRGGAIGDFILTVPALQTLRNHWQECTLDLICREHISELAKVTGIAERTISLDSAEIAQLYSPSFDVNSQIADYIKSFDMILCYLYDPDKVLQNNLTRIITHPEKRIIFHSPVGIKCHAIEHFMEALKTLKIPVQKGVIPYLKLPVSVMEKSRNKLQQSDKNIITIHPGSGSMKKNWKIENFVELANFISSRNITPVFILGEAEEKLSTETRQLLQQFKVAEKCSLVETAGIIAISKGYIGNDSGITHLASALGVPTIALFGPTDTDIWGPRGRNVTIIKSPDGKMSSISVNTVLEHVRRKIIDPKNPDCKI